MVVVVFRSRLRQGVGTDIEAVGHRMYELATSMPGFESYHEYSDEEGETVAIIEFASHEALAAWREHPEHLVAQQAGREHWFSEYRITVCDVVRDYAFTM